MLKGLKKNTEDSRRKRVKLLIHKISTSVYIIYIEINRKNTYRDK